MTYIPLQNYLRTHRRRNNLSQRDIAYLFGIANRTSVARYEGGSYTPSLTAALGYELLFGVPAGELFAGEVTKVESIIRERLPELIRRTEKEASPEDSHKLSFLRAVAERLAQHDETSRSEDARA